MSQLDKENYGVERFRGEHGAKDFPELGVDDPNSDDMMDQVAGYVKSNPGLAVLSMFATGVVIGAGIAAASYANRRQRSHSYSFDALGRRISDSVAASLPHSLRDTFSRG